MWIIGYGSLMDRRQLIFKDFQLITVKGWKRIFNRTSLSHIWDEYIDKDKVAVLNIIKSPENYFNGVAYKIDHNELRKLLKREVAYHIVNVKSYKFNTDNEFKECNIFISDKRDKQNKKILEKNILPIPRYLRYCKKAAYSWGKEFGREFEKTTYLADGKTKIGDYFI